MSNVQNVTTAKPKIGGAVWSAPFGTTLPISAVADLDPKFESLGYISEEGLVKENTPESENIKAWGGNIVANVQTEKSDSFTFTLIEAMNVNVLKEIYGKDNVTGTIETGIKIKANNKEHEEHVLVVDMVLKGSILKRIVLPAAKVSEVGEINYVDDNVVGYETTIQALPADDEGNTHFEYIQEGVNASSGGGGTD